jgi:hypothetical protein
LKRLTGLPQVKKSFTNTCPILSHDGATAENWKKKKEREKNKPNREKSIYLADHPRAMNGRSALSVQNKQFIKMIFQAFAAV